MSKKGLISSLIIGAVTTLALGIYTLVSVFGGVAKPEGPINTTVSKAYRTGDMATELSGYSVADGNLTLTLPEGVVESPLHFNEEEKTYQAVRAGEVTAVVSYDEIGSTTTYNIKVYQQGNGESSDSPYIIASEDHLKEFADKVNTLDAERSVPKFTKLVSDIDLSSYNWKPIGGQGDTAYTGEFDGNGFTIKNLKINVDVNNYLDFLSVIVEDIRGEKVKCAYMDIGLFGRTENATIKNLNISNAVLSISSELYDITTASQSSNTELFERIARVTVGTIAGSAYETDIIGNEQNPSTIISRINAYSQTNEADGIYHGIGGVVGVSQLLRVQDYNISVNVNNYDVSTKGSYIGGIAGVMNSTRLPWDTEDKTPEDQSKIERVNVDFSATVLYSNTSIVAGMVAIGRNVAILDSNVTGFKIVDPSSKKNIDYSMKTPTLVAGVVADMQTLVHSYFTTPITPKIINVNVSNVNVYMLGGDAAGVIGTAGRNDGELDKLVISDVTVSGAMTANTVAGFAHQVNPGAQIVYTKAFDGAVVDLKITADASAGFVFNNTGVITGFKTEEGVLTKVKVETTGMGARITSADLAYIENARKATYASGFVANSYNKHTSVTPTISNFDVRFTAVSSINYAGFAYSLDDTIVNNINVTSNFTSYNYIDDTKNYSTTYMVAGVVCNLYAGTEINNMNVIVNVNKDVNKANKYGATFFGGVAARYYGDESGVGVSINNVAVGGDVYFNYSGENVKFSGEAESVNVFVAGGLIGAIEGYSGSVAYVDGLTVVSIAKTKINNNTVNDLKITADINQALVSAQAWRARAIGALVGVINANETEVLDLSTNVIENVVIDANEEAFTYEFVSSGNTISKIYLGAGKVHSYGSSYAWAWKSDTTKVKEPTNVTEKVTYPA